jgi:hypothetical protein
VRIGRNRAQVILFAAAVVLAGGCALGRAGSDGGPKSSPVGGATTTPPPSTPTPTPVVTTTPPPPPLILTTPQAAAEHLYNAWKANNKPDALRGATTSAVTALFKIKWKTGVYFFGGCTTPTAPSECDYNWASGIIAMHISGNATSGFKVTSVGTGSAG